jgi:hypothetical protein
VFALLIVLLGSSLRFYNLGGDSLWYDEILTANVARSGYEAISHVRSHPPLFYLLTRAAIDVLGESEFALRLPSAIAGILALPLVAVLGRTLGRPRAGLWASLLLTLSPFHLRYSQEGRHYALLMTLSLLTFILLYRAFTVPKLERWVAFALATVLNLYTHYGALLVLASQGVLIAVWLLKKGGVRQGQLLSFVLVSALVVAILFLPQIQHLWGALQHNLGEGAERGSTNITPVSVWLQTIYLAFGFRSEVLAFVIAGVVISGFCVWARDRDWDNLLLATAGLFVPVLLIALFRVSRWAFPKYVIYSFPFYLLAAGVALDALLIRAERRLGKDHQTVLALGTAVVALGFVSTGLVLLQDEHERMERDWRGLVSYLGQVADDGDLVFSTVMDLRNGFNQGELALSYYLKRTSGSSSFLVNGPLETAKLEALADTDADIWGVFINRVKPVKFEANDVQSMEFQGRLYLVHVTDQRGSTLEKTKYLYEQILPLSVAPSPQCLLRQDLAALFTVSQDYLISDQLMEEAIQQCPKPPVDGGFRHSLVGEINRGLLDHYLQSGEREQAFQIATRMLQQDAKDQVAWEIITFENLLQVFQEGGAHVTDDLGPEPVQIMRFVMPRDGDWGDVLLIHPPASVSYRIDLPEEPTTLHTRVAMAPESWEWGGDGSTFVLRVETDSSPQIELYRHHVSNHPDDRGWHGVSVSLEEYAGQTVTLTLATEAGPLNDSTGDWAGLEEPRITWQKSALP